MFFLACKYYIDAQCQGRAVNLRQTVGPGREPGAHSKKGNGLEETGDRQNDNKQR